MYILYLRFGVVGLLTGSAYIAIFGSWLCNWGNHISGCMLV